MTTPDSQILDSEHIFASTSLSEFLIKFFIIVDEVMLIMKEHEHTPSTNLKIKYTQIFLFFLHKGSLQRT
ncbi:hypothetical protein AQUCO_00100832v1 [Aquilegia coerulea]|uniref:Uncharacterized protein n=1 Tax=Aquilegia coerulea TaxID=218851 RepID=A0A2G5FC51_AQUCA|nr:hypothetical protein AQUCO_00100832v1 [Aquilegia coerulea]